MPSNHLFCHPLLLLPSIFPSIRVFSNELAFCIRWPKYWSFSFSISPSDEYSVLISFRTDWFDLLVVQGTLKSLLQYHSSKASVLPCSAFFMVQLSHWYMTTGKTIALTKWTFVGKVMSLLFNVLSRLVVAFLPICTIKWLHDQMTWNYTTIKTDVKFLVLILYSDSVRCNCWAKLDERYMRLICFCSFLWIYNYFNIKIF